MVEETIEICGKCGKIPRSVDFDVGTGEFMCSRCGNRELMLVTSGEYERVVAELEDQFTREAIRARAPPVVQEAELPEMEPKKEPNPVVARPAAPKAVRKTVKKAKKPAKKAAKKTKKAVKKPKKAAKKTVKGARKKAAPKKKAKPKKAAKKRKR